MEIFLRVESGTLGPKPKVMITTLLSSLAFPFLMAVMKMSLLSVGYPSVRNRMTSLVFEPFLGFEAYRRSNALVKARP